MVDRPNVEKTLEKAVHAIMPGIGLSGAGFKHLKDLGADSVDRIEILLTVMKELGINRPLSAFVALPTIDSLIDYLEKEVNNDD